MSTFSYLANNKETTEKMLKELGLKSLNDLFLDIPPQLILKQKPSADLPDPHSELETSRRLLFLSQKNLDSASADIFLGSGIYDHFIPASVTEIANRAEFKTAYTPYAPELSQGLLTTLYEYQSMICELTGLEVANTSMYDWSTALAESALMCMRIKNKIKDPVFLVSTAIHPERLATLETYAKPLGLKIVKMPCGETGYLETSELETMITENTIGVYVENPNIFGIIQTDLKQIIDVCHNHEVLSVIGIDPLSLGVLESPGALGADICVGEAHHLGNNPNFGGPGLGVLTSRNTKINIRNMPGRIIGYTTTKDNTRDAYIMTLQTREQHIRREKATSNICTNESLFSVAAVAYLSILGPKGLEAIGLDIMGKIDYFVSNLNSKKLPIKVIADGPFFREALVKVPKQWYSQLKGYLIAQNIVIGPDLMNQIRPEKLFSGFIFSITEKHTKEQIDKFIDHLVKFCDQEGD